LAAPPGVVVLATLVSVALGPILSRIPFALFFAAIAIVARYAGLGPALVASVLGVLLADRFVIPPRTDGEPIFLDQVVVALILVLVAALISSITAQLRSAQARERQQRESLRESCAPCWPFRTISTSPRMPA
jgi:two-component system, OmpR family, sensor histidine kinase KdpD